MTELTLDSVTQRVLHELDKESWFAACGEPVTDGEMGEAERYVMALGIADCDVLTVADWREAERIISNPDWDHRWWEIEEQEQQRLLEAAKAQFGAAEAMHALSVTTEKSADVFYGPAAISAGRAGVADQALTRSAAGSASQSCFQYHLALLNGADNDHFFLTKFRLFLAGRWPLCVVNQHFYLF